MNWHHAGSGPKIEGSPGTLHHEVRHQIVLSGKINTMGFIRIVVVEETVIDRKAEILRNESAKTECQCWLKRVDCR